MRSVKHILPVFIGIAVLLLMRAIFGEDSALVSLPAVIATGVVALAVIIFIAKRNMAKAEAEAKREENGNG
jgi:uncharacterized membrane protein YuzA (DUF378 family)